MVQLPGMCIAEVETRTNARIKLYASKYLHQVCNVDLFSTGRFEACDGKSIRPYSVPSKGNAKDSDRSHFESRRRAVSAVRDIALCNHFDYMFTWTLNGALIDRYDSKAIYDKVKVFLKNAVARKGFQYILIPEYHVQKEGEDKPAIHMHGLCCLGDVKLSPALKDDGSQRVDESGRKIFNMDQWHWGFSTCVPLDGNYERAVNYITKYITDTEIKIFGKWYLSSRNLQKRPEIIPLSSESFYEFRDEHKLSNKEQTETSVYRDIKIISEEVAL